ncbi:helix-turn-helix domain-containing protein [Larkinella ripae]
MDAILGKGKFTHPGLQQFVLRYEVVRFVFGKNVAPPTKYFAPRPEQSLTFYPRDPQRFRYVDKGTIVTYPHAIVHGMHTVPIYRYGGHDFLAIRIVFQPGALYRLTGIPSPELSNTFVDAEAIWSSAIRIVSQRLNSCNNMTEMLQIIESFLVNVVHAFRKQHHAVDVISTLILNQREHISLDQLADLSCLSVRQFIRKFEERIGLSPKQFDRIARFDKAFRMRNKYPSLDLLSIAVSCGYYDYQHFAKDCKELTYLAPTSFFEEDLKAAEHVFGLREK